jgi:hypothetical protein
VSADAYLPPADVREQFAILRAAGWRWIPTVSKGAAYNPTTREQITHDELRTMTPEQIAARVKGTT